VKKIVNLAKYIPENLTVYEFLTELNEKQLNEMKEMVAEVELNLKRALYFREDLDELNQNNTYYRWEFNEEYTEGGESIWYNCLDYLHNGHAIILSRQIPDEEWTIIFASIPDRYPGSTEMYLKDKREIVISSLDVNEIVKYAENYIIEYKGE
jgi:hypothetical protein